MKRSMHRASLLVDALNELTEMEMAFADLQEADVFQSFTTKEKAHYLDVLTRLRDLIRELEEDSAQTQRAS
jgi:predicted YcjX-like family ATPase